LPKDVYAGDIAQTNELPQARSRVVFRIEADAEPDAFQRIVTPLILANRVPSSAILVLQECGGEPIVCLEVVLQPIPLTTVQLIARKLAQLTCVRNVEFREVHQPE
jgi:hypothetical protein